MTLDDVPADVLIILTDELDRLFKFAYCNPTCHTCNTKISIGDSFQLISYRGRDHMACVNCDREKMEKARRKDMKDLGYKWSDTKEEYYLPVHKGYSRQSRVP